MESRISGLTKTVNSKTTSGRAAKQVDFLLTRRANCEMFAAFADARNEGDICVLLLTTRIRLYFDSVLKS